MAISIVAACCMDDAMAVRTIQHAGRPGGSGLVVGKCAKAKHFMHFYSCCSALKV